MWNRHINKKYVYIDYKYEFEHKQAGSIYQVCEKVESTWDVYQKGVTCCLIKKNMYIQTRISFVTSLCANETPHCRHPPPPTSYFNVLGARR